MPNLKLSQPEAEPKFKIFSGALKATETNGRKLISCTASSSVEDLHGDTITAECVRDMVTQAKQKGMTIFLNHRYAVPEDVMGSTIDTKATSRAHEKDGTAIWDMDLDMVVNETNPRALNTYAAIKDAGVKLGVSIGANIKDWEFKDAEKGWWGGLIIKEVELLEASIVGIPANPRSWVQNGVRALKSAYGVTDDEFDVTADAAGSLDEEREHEGTGVKMEGVEVPVGTTATLTVLADGTSKVEIAKEGIAEDETEAGSEPAAEEEGESAPTETTDEPESEETAKAEEPTSPVDLEAAKAVATSADDTSEDSSTMKALVLSLVENLEQAIADRDAARAEVKAKAALLADAAEIIDIIAKTSLGRRTSISLPTNAFKARLSGIYDPEYLDMIERD